MAFLSRYIYLGFGFILHVYYTRLWENRKRQKYIESKWKMSDDFKTIVIHVNVKQCFFYSSFVDIVNILIKHLVFEFIFF